MMREFVYLVAIVDWFSRRVLAWRMSITLTTDFCIETLEEALAPFGKPDISNTDQRSQFTSVAFPSVLHREKIAISMVGKGARRDNVFVECLWNSVKYEEVYLRAYLSVSDPRSSIGRYLTFYNTDGRIPHLTARRPIRPTSTTASRSGMKPADASLNNRASLFKQTGPPLNECLLAIK